MTKAVDWTPALDKRCRDILRKHPYGKARDALQEIQRCTGCPITYDALQKRFARMGFGTPISNTGKGQPDAPPVPPANETLDAMFCEHANENPAFCPCPSNCYCRAHTCKDKHVWCGVYDPGAMGENPDPAPSPAAPPEDAEGDGPPTDRFVSPLEYIERAVENDERSRHRKEVDALTRELRDAKVRQEFIDACEEHSEPPKIWSREPQYGVRELTAVVLASDWHVEETVAPETIAYRNEYNLEIAAQRVDRFFESVIWNVEHQRASGKLTIRDLVLWLGGDLITGFIHDELIESNGLHPMEAVLWLQPKLRDGIASLVHHLDLDRLEVPCSHGNHSRTTKKVHVANGHKHSYEWMMYNFLARELECDPRIHFEITGSRHQYVQVYDWMLHFHHGDELKYQGGVGGLGIPLLKRVPQWDLVKRADVHNIGHFHQLLDFGRAVVNGSLIGYNAYAQSIGASAEPPQQAMYYMDRARGKCLTTALWVDDRKHAKAA